MSRTASLLVCHSLPRVARISHPRTTQCEKLLAVFLSAPGDGWVPLTEILQLGIAQYSPRIKELRDMGYIITNRQKRVDGKTHSWFRLETARVPVSRPIADPPACQTIPPGGPRDPNEDRLFPDDAPLRHLDLG